ncbi:hypothetical protein GCM10010302_78520 [Streptomyces polychromogenes]|uniref:Helicase-associated domain-containing protein n=1 Tax=Streptomyces polychromogenes TaxID=67342 RepID=A0ABP3FXR2_9ACTN
MPRPASTPKTPTVSQAAIDKDWNPGERGWTVDWQRHYAYLTQLLDEGARLTAITPGVTRHREDIGRWLATQRRDWNRLNPKQQTRLGKLGVTPARVVRACQAPAKKKANLHVGPGRGSLRRGRTGPGAVPRPGRRRSPRPTARRTIARWGGAQDWGVGG